MTLGELRDAVDEAIQRYGPEVPVWTSDYVWGYDDATEFYWAEGYGAVYGMVVQ